MKKTVIGCLTLIASLSYGEELKYSRVNIESNSITYMGVTLSVADRDYRIAKDTLYKAVDMWDSNIEKIKAFDYCAALGESYEDLKNASIEYSKVSTGSSFAQIDFRMAPDLSSYLSFSKNGNLKIGKVWTSPKLDPPLVRTGQRRSKTVTDELVSNIVCERK